MILAQTPTYLIVGAVFLVSIVFSVVSARILLDILLRFMGRPTLPHQ
jgi:hypothetical protein